MWMQTLQGEKFSFVNMADNEFRALEVAVQLSRAARFAGATRWPYSVAQHCCLVASHFTGRMRLPALLHDAHEAFTGDVTTPLKRCLRMAGCSELDVVQLRIDEWIARRHDFEVSRFALVKPIDLAAFATERRDLLLPMDWGDDAASCPAPFRERIVPWHPDFARDEWLRMYEELVF